MRVSDKMNFDQVNMNLSRNRSKMQDLQAKASTQKRVTKPSDDPIAASRVLSSRVQKVTNEQHMKNLKNVQSFLNYTDQTLGELTENLNRAKELALSQANDPSASPETRRAVAAEIAQLGEQIVKLGNRKLGDRFIFGGFQTTKPPFDAKGNYRGDTGEILIPVDSENFVAMNIPGLVVFRGEGLSRDGTAVSDSNPPRTIEEFLAEQKSIENGNVKENQGPHRSDDVSDRLVEVRSPSSLAEGQSDQNESLEGSHIGVNLFNVVKNLEIGLMANDKTTIQESLEELDQAAQQVVLARADVGSRVSTLSNTLDSLQVSAVDTAAEISELEDADIFKVVSDINQTEQTLQATLQTSGSLIEPKLLDYLR